MINILMTVDTEGDNLWDYHKGDPISTENAKYIPRFQMLCEHYGIIPVYLVNYEMAQSDVFVDYIRPLAAVGKCEIGMHVHAWNSPPIHELNGNYSGNAYITEYPYEVVFEKHRYLRDLISERFGVTPVTYRSGRWATNDDLFDILEKLGFCVDCSITPGINHNTPGETVQRSNNYQKALVSPYRLREHLWEIPMTTDLKRSLRGNSFRRKIVNTIRGEQRWLRPAIHETDELFSLMDDFLSKGSKYLMFMIHSSELMPGGSPYCRNSNDVNKYLEKLEEAFQHLPVDSRGCSIRDYYTLLTKEYCDE